jgi:hypothetical protein
MPFKLATLSSCALLLAAQAQAAIDPAPVKLGGFELIPTLSVDELHDDNITMANGETPTTKEISSWVTVVAPELQLGIKNDKSEYNLGYKLVAGRYASSRDDDYVDHFLNADAAWQLSSRNKIAVRGNYDRAHEDRGSDTSGDIVPNRNLQTPDEYRLSIVGGTYTFGADTTPGRLVLDVEDYNKKYTNHRDTTAERDRNDKKATGTFYWSVSSATKLLLEGEYTDINYDKSRPDDVRRGDYDGSLARGFVGVEWDISGKTTGTVKVGYQEKEFDSINRKDYSGTSWDAAMTWSPKTYSTFTLSSGNKPQESSGIGDFIDAENITVGWQHGWSDNINTSVYLMALNEDYVNSFNDRNDDSINAGVSVDYTIKRWVSVSLAYDYSDKDSSVRSVDGLALPLRSSFDFDRNKFTLGVDLSF